MSEYQFDPSIICPKDLSATPERVRQYEKHYRVKYDIARELGPKVIVEIGVRAGYSAWAFLSACPEAEYHGFDAENQTHGGQGGPWAWWASEMLSERGFNFQLHVPLDTQMMKEMPISAELYHIDGDHTAKGVMHDLTICFAAAPEGAVLLVDDYDYEEAHEVRIGVDKWLKENDVASYEHRESLRGEMLITK